jgi:UDP-glucose 4-epimerase
MPTVVVTGGCGYIGSHTLVELIDGGFGAVSIDNNVRSTPASLEGVRAITGRDVINYPVDLRDQAATDAVFDALAASVGSIHAVIHFAAFKSVPESVREPLLYYENNIRSLVNVLRAAEKHDVPHFVFSSSCSVYGNIATLPVTEDAPLHEAESPYARTKQIGEQILQDLSKVSRANVLTLRYFNPVGAHESALVGEVPYGGPENLVPAITQTGIGKRDQLVVYGIDYRTRDGTCVRDYVHVSDIARAHVDAVRYLTEGRNESNYEVFNLGSGTGVTVLEAIAAFERASGVALNVRMGPRRPGDVEAIYAENRKARERLGWRPSRDVNVMMSTAWAWEQKLAERQDRHAPRHLQI